MQFQKLSQEILECWQSFNISSLKHNVFTILYFNFTLYKLRYLNMGSTCKIYLDKISKLQKWAIRTISNSSIEATPDLCSLNLMFLMYTIHLSSILVYSCINITQISFHHFFQRILLNMFKHIIIQQEMPKITVSIKQRKCSLIVQLEIADLLFWILWIKLSNIVKPPNTSEISWNHFYYLNTIDFILGHVLCVLVYLLDCV